MGSGPGGEDVAVSCDTGSVGFAALLFLLTTQTPPAPAVESVPPTRLVYLPGRWAASCPGDAEVKEAVASRLGRAPFAEPAERVVVLVLDGEGEVPTRARAELFAADFASLGVRSLESAEGCRELVEASALAISIALAPELALQPPPPAVEPPPVEPPPVEPPSVEAPPPPPPAPASAGDEPVDVEASPPTFQAPSWLPEGAVLLVGGGAAASVGLSPQTVTGFHLGLGARQGDLELRLEQRQILPSFDGTLGVVHGGSAWSILPCAHLPLFSVRGDGDRLGLMTCASATAGNLWSLGAYSGGAFHAGLGGRLAVEWTQHDLSSMRAWLQTELALVRPGFYALNGPPVWEQDSLVNAVIGVTWETSWPP